MNNIDTAALRRFDLKLKFEFLNPQQVAGLATEQARLLKLPELGTQEIVRLQKLGNLTPGDFAAVFRQHQFAPFETANEWITALAGECALKPSAKCGQIGFL